VKGKLSYLSPEVTYGQPATPLSDLFAMGTVMWEALAGQRLFEGKTDLDVFKQIRNCEVRPLSAIRPELPRALFEIVDKSLAADPAKRYPSARSMAVALAEVLKTAASTGDAQAALGAAVHDARVRLYRRAEGKDDQPTWTYALEEGPSSIDIEFSKPDLTQPPVPLTKKKT
jgi:serine/threonine-protein kinase